MFSGLLFSLVFRILPYVRGNVGFVFTNEELKEMRDMLESFKVG